MAIMSDLSQDLVEEVLARVPLTSQRTVRLTCKNWNDLSKDGSFIKKQIVEAKKKQANEFDVIMVMNFRVYLMSVNLSNVDPSIRPKGKIISLNNANHQIEISRVFHCDGLLLCITKDIDSRLVVWNPYFGQTKWIKPRNSYHIMDNYALGYEKKLNNSYLSYKILRFLDIYYSEDRICEFELYCLKSNSWKVLDVTSPIWDIDCYHHGLSLKGNIYWYAKEKNLGQEDPNDFLICFDFTTERFGPRLPLPFHSTSTKSEDTIILSSVGDEQLAVLYQCEHTYRMEIWVTSKIEPKEVSWNKLFLAFDMNRLSGFEFLPDDGSFFIDQKTNVAMVFDKDRGHVSNTRSIAYTIGKKDYFKKVNLGESPDPRPSCFPLVCPYVPSSVLIKQLT